MKNIKSDQNMPVKYRSCSKPSTGVQMRTDKKGAEKIETIMEELFDSMKGIKRISVVSKSGIKVAGSANPRGGEETISALTSIMFSAAETAEREVFDDDIDRLEVHSRGSILLISELNENLLVVIHTENSVDLQELRRRIDGASRRIKSEIGP